MPEPGFPIAAVPRTVAACAECGVPLAPDQRYCVNCGARCIPLPADLLGVALENAGAPEAAQRLAAVTAPPDTSFEGRAAAFLAALPPRAVALSVMSMLAFGVVVGSGATSLANTSSSPLILAYNPPQATTSAPATTPSGSGGGGGGGGGAGGTTTVVQTVTAQTVTAPSSSGGGGGGGGNTTPSTPATGALPPIRHVFVVMLSSVGFKALYGPGSKFPYLATTLRKQGELLDNYYGVAGSPLANSIALLSGQGPTQQTAQDCPQYTLLSPGTMSRSTIGTGKQAQGDGCIYPAQAESLPDQLAANGQTWKGYIEGMSTPEPPAGSTTTGTTGSATTGSPPTGSPTTGGPTTGSTTATGATTTAPTPAATTSGTTTSGTTTSGTTTSGTATIPPGGQTACRHPNVGSTDPDQTASTQSPYVTWRNPFAYFQTLVTATTCAQQDVSLEQLAKDLHKDRTAPTLAYIAPSPCNDGSGVSCTPGQAPDPTAVGAATDAFLKTTISEIEASPAYKNGNGLIVITADNAPQTGPAADPSACCNNPVYPNMPAPAGGTGTTSGMTTGGTTTGGTTSSGTTTSATTSGGTTSTPTTTASTTTTPTTTASTTTSSTTTTSSSSTTTTTPLSGGSTTPTGGGGQVGALLISKYTKANSEDTLDYFNHYALLASIEQLFSLNRLGYATEPQLTLFQPGVVYNNVTP